MQANQTWLHQKIKKLYSTEENAEQETTIEINSRNYRIDVLKEQRTAAYEIQLSNFGQEFSSKIRTLLGAQLRVIIVHPVAVLEKVIWMSKGEQVGSRTVNKRADIYTLFDELVHFKTDFVPDRMGFDVLLTEEAVWKEFIGFRGRTRRPRYRQIQRDLLHVRETHLIRKKNDFITLLPENLPPVFTNRELAERLTVQGGKRRKIRIAGRMTYSLCRLGIIDHIGINGRAHEFAIRKNDD
ncbi:MAG: hypothetical protein ACE5OZ_07770 [Candidatus Heimdallarchaeota archaeon]